jgi:hypothetical protein
MELQNPAASSAMPPASSGRERHVEPVLGRFLAVCLSLFAPANHSQVLLHVSTFNEIIDQIANARNNASGSQWDIVPILSFDWPASELHELDQLDARLVEIDQPKVRRFEYDYVSRKVYIDIMPESPLHAEFQAAICEDLRVSLGELFAVTNDAAIRRLIKSFKDRGTASIKIEGKLDKQADISFAQAGNLPLFVAEIS